MTTTSSFVTAKTLLRGAVALVLCLKCANASAADAYPAKPVRLIVPISAGGGTDLIARLIQPRLVRELGQPVVVDNRPGGNTTIGVGLAAKSPPDGYTLLLVNANFTINAALSKHLPYDPQKDFTAISPLADSANVLVVNAAAIPARSAQELVALLRARPGQLNFGAGGAGTTSSLAAVLLQSLAKVDFVIVQYKGAGPALTDLLGGHVQIGNYAMSIVLPHIKSGRLRALGVATARRSVLMPEMPTIAESGVPEYEVRTWYGVLSSRGTPSAIVKTLNATLRKVIEDGEIQKLMAAQGLESFLAPPEEFEKFIKTEISTWTKLGADFKLSVDTD